MVQYTQKGDSVYAICLAWPGKLLRLDRPATTPQTQVRMLGCGQALSWTAGDKGINIQVPPMSVREIPCRNAWVFKLTGLKRSEATRIGW